jgi:carbonic anhydrase/acetyltransferase-like protein (isoleucine patch superfamily)
MRSRGWIGVEVLLATSLLALGVLVRGLERAVALGEVAFQAARVDPNTFLSPGVTVCGFARIGRDCFIGAGAVVMDRCGVPDGSFVRAGEVRSRPP